MTRGKDLARAALRWRRRARWRLRTPLAVATRRAATTIGALMLALVALVFAKLGDLAQHGFASVVAAVPLLPLLLTPALFALVAYGTRRWVPEARGSGIPQVMAAARVPGSAIMRRLVSPVVAAVKLVFTLVMLLAGASVGREGPTVQVGAAVMVAIHRLLRVPITPGVVIAGGAAGVAAAFNTPLAGVAFAIEELAAAYEQRVAVLVMGAVMISGLATLGLAGDYVYFGVLRTSLSVRAVIVLAPLVGVFGGAAGALFSRAVLGFGRSGLGWIGKVRARPVLLAAGCGLVVALLGIASGGATWGTGYGATRAMVEGAGASIWFGPAKFVAALATTLSGTPGGIFAPSLAVGAGLGNLVASFAPDQPAGAIVLLGMAAYFVGVTRAPLTAIIILTETTAARSMILPLFLTALIADGVSGWISPERLYHGLSKPFLAGETDEGGAAEPGA